MTDPVSPGSEPGTLIHITMRKPLIRSIFIVLFLVQAVGFVQAQETQRIWLSGKGGDQTVDWEFFCTDGRQSGNWTTIPVPSQWEQHGFGKYDYGHAKDSVRGKEKGLYRYPFDVPVAWKGMPVNIVFEGSMTDTEVRINGQSAGSIHQGSFYRFSYDISGLLEYGKKNLLEVTVAKHSSNESVNRAERYADFWIFGGIFRPVYLEVKPAEHIRNFKVDARADGSLIAEVYTGILKKADEITALIMGPDGKRAGGEITVKVDRNTRTARIETVIPSPGLWSMENPQLYTLQLSLRSKGTTLHIVSDRFGFRTVELRERDGFYLNGRKIKFKGVNRHSFRPETGRSLSREQCIEDALLIKDMNMNAVRNSHYPADEYFLDACDSLGILVMDELTGWHDAYDTETGSKLATEMLESNHNHPCIVIWANGNEGGHNPEVDPVFDSLDIQHRPVCHPWITFRGMDTQHYINYDYGNSTHFHGHEVVFPTEFLHGLYDGGHGAGLYDYWEYMWDLPLSAGGFLWDFADGGIIRTDLDNIIDTDGNHAADGILGPHHEKEASYYTIKEVFSPVFFEHREITPGFDGSFIIGNRYSFTNTDRCTFSYRLAGWDGTASAKAGRELTGTLSSPSIEPGAKGRLVMELPAGWQDFDVLYITAADPAGKEIYTWSWPVQRPADLVARTGGPEGTDIRMSVERDSLLVVKAGGLKYTFNKNSGLLAGVENEEGKIPFTDGPVLCDGVSGYEGMDTRVEDHRLLISCRFSEESNYREMQWTVHPSGWLELSLLYRPSAYEFDMFGVSFSYPEELVNGVRWFGDGPYRVWKNRMRGTSLGVHEKEYNNTITGKRDYIYPEFKGYHSNLYWVKFLTKEQDFTVYTANEDIFLRLFTPEFPDDPFNTAPVFPGGDISFMHGIPAIGTKSQLAQNMGPSGKKNMYFDFWKARARELHLYFDFSSGQ